ncbi:energy-coupling factor ABC transporter ATP-binding protein [Pararhodospirillum oryzae]|uniref:Cobalt ABC transporter ATP-binding protein n=1 Tax=Pararhodospirillum oryzae TaxID=478448 RepID=A0A512H647_9PROT|nr:ABC transporter ATP-binding protein [Pararhodospirillum oryzae]GEO80860.1 cobalt ABC transporter ATP-binding protein [Pararhodospirillum oryzae]
MIGWPRRRRARPADTGDIPSLSAPDAPPAPGTDPTTGGVRFDGVRVETPEGRVLLADLNVTLSEPRIGLIGPNGAGKSTFLRLINALVRPTQGRVWVDGLDAGRETRAVRRRVGFLFQAPEAQIIMPTPAEDVAFGLEPLRLGRAATRERALAALARFGLAERADQPAFALSGGEKQRLALAAVLALDPALVLMDEPTTQLDLAGRRMFARVLGGLAQRVILATHDLDLLNTFDRVLVIDQGRIVFDGPPAPARAAYEALVLAREAVDPGAAPADTLEARA